MKKLNLLAVLFLLLSVSAWAQESSEDTGAPVNRNGRADIPGSLYFDLGFSLLQGRPADMETSFFGSKVVNVYYQRDLNLGKNSGFTFAPGIGLGLERYAFDGQQTLIFDRTEGTSSLGELSDIYGAGLSVNKSKLIANYVDIPVEFKYHTNKNDYSRGFRVALGAKFGVLYHSHTKSKFEQDGESRTVKDRQGYALNSFRYGAYARLGFNGFNFWSYYGLSEVFESGKGPSQTEANTLSFGVSIAW
ncbi:outer membrane beta-barrel protein [Penaeicola halotolerans]|uniref:outer membrane beta-barrel protein n=1 Tax=Penaeicola halotolerans TaxID=2793196 RepID=UPI001CF87B23|nr:outer membrane beta-barrel protein [Penaeicola halotolerans]